MAQNEGNSFLIGGGSEYRAAIGDLLDIVRNQHTGRAVANEIRRLGLLQIERVAQLFHTTFPLPPGSKFSVFLGGS